MFRLGPVEEQREFTLNRRDKGRGKLEERRERGSMLRSKDSAFGIGTRYQKNKKKKK